MFESPVVIATILFCVAGTPSDLCEPWSDKSILIETQYVRVIATTCSISSQMFIASLSYDKPDTVIKIICPKKEKIE